VTIVSDDMFDYKVHKCVLSACSPLIMAILLQNRHEHPLIYLSGVRNQELQYILQFLYFGKVNVNLDHMENLLQILEELEINGFKVSTNGTQNIKKELVMRNDIRLKRKSSRRSGTRQEMRNTIIEKLDLDVVSMHKCEQCDASFKHPADLRRHKESVHEGVRFNCDQCNQTFANRGGVIKHRQNVHEGIRYECYLCDYKAAQRANLKQHNKKIHMQYIEPKP